jgi:hypothetical protein
MLVKMLGKVIAAGALLIQARLLPVELCQKWSPTSSYKLLMM